MEPLETKKAEIIAPDFLAGLTNEVNERVGHIAKLIVCDGNLKAVTEYRTANNKFIKDIEAKMDEAKQEIIRATIGEAIDKVAEAIAPLKEANKKFSADILDADKLRFKDKAKEIFDKLNDGGESGEIYDWDTFYEDKWYKMKQIDLIDAIQRKLRVLRMKEDMTDRTYFITATEEQFERIEKWLGTLQIIYERG